MATKQGTEIHGSMKGEFPEILSSAAVAFLVTLHRSFNARRLDLLKLRQTRQAEIDSGKFPSFLEETRSVRENPAWKGAPPAPGLVDRRVEITGPVDRKMVINALNSGATQFMADFEDSNAPTWENNLNGQINLRDAIHRNISFTAPNGKFYKLKDKVATLLVRPRGWHLEEKHFIVDGQPISASLFDFGLYFFHNAKKSIEIGQGPYFYLPKMESHLEARLWNDVFNAGQDYIGLPRGTIRATCLIETILGAFEMEEIIFELRDHSSGLNCGRWDYIFSAIKKFRNYKACVLPDRAQVTMTVPFMEAYVNLLIQTCHRRGVHAMGGMAAQIPIKNDPAANQQALDKVRKDKLREAKAGHDGTWVAHPDLIVIAKEIFDAIMPQPNQIFNHGSQKPVCGKDLLNFHIEGGRITEHGVRENLSSALRYMEAWLSGNGCVPINHLMEDAATAEIARSQIWQWIRHKSVTAEGHQITPGYVEKLLNEELDKIKQEMGSKYAGSKFALAKQKFFAIVTKPDFEEFLTSFCYDNILSVVGAKGKL